MANNTETIRKILQIDLKQEDVMNRLFEIGNALKAVKKEEKQLNDARKNHQITRDEYRRGVENIAQKTKQLKTEQSALRKEMQNSIRTTTQAEGSLNSLRARLINARTEYDALSKSERETGERGKELRKEMADLNKQILKIEQSTGRSQRNVGNYGTALKGLRDVVLRMGFGVLGVAQGMVAFGERLREGVETSIQFNREVSKLSAILLKTPQEITALTAKAKELGSTTRYTARQVVELEVELAKLGYQEPQILNMSEGVLHLAQATGSSLAEAAALAGAALRIFGDDSSKTSMYVDQMATAVSKSALSFDYIKTALPIVGGAAEMFGFSLQDTLALLGQLANSGMEASMAATATRNIFLKLADSNGLLAQELGRPVKSLKDLTDGMRELKSRGANLNDALELTNVRAAVAFTRFLNSADAADDLAKKMHYATDEAELLDESLEKCNGTAEKMADTMEDNLGGDITKLGSIWGDFMLSLQKGQGPLRKTVQWLTSIVENLGLIARSAQESMDIQTNSFLEDYGKSDGALMQAYNKTDKALYESEKNRLTELYKSQNMKNAELQAEIDARASVLSMIDEETKKLKGQYEIAKKEREDAEKSSKGLVGGELYKLNNEELADYIVGDNAGIEDRNTLLGRIGNRVQKAQEILEKRMAESSAAALMKAQENRIEFFNSSFNDDGNKDGIGAEDDAKRNKRLQREKSAAKALLAARQAYENAVLKNVKESKDKEIEITNNQYKHEIENLQIKIDEELKMRGDESAKEAADKLAAIDYYNLAIAEKTKEWNDKLKNIEKEYIDKEYKYLKEYTDLALDAIENSSDDETKILNKKYLLRLDLLEKEKAKEVAALEVAAAKDEKIAEELEKRKTLIMQKYAKKRNELSAKYVEDATDAIVRNLQAQEYNTNDPLSVLNLKSREAMQNFQKLQQETYRATKTDSELALEEAQAWNTVLQVLDDIKQKKIELSTQDEELAKLIRVDDNGNMRASNALEQAQSEVEIARMKYEQISNIGKLELETEQEYQLRKAQAYRDYVTARESLAQKELQIASTVTTSVVGGLESIVNAIAESSDKNKSAAKLAKILGLAQVWINNGIAISEVTRNQSSGDPYTMFARIAAAIAQVTASTISAVSSINKAKFAKGVVNLQGAGTTTSDSINARLSQGESVMTARATDMFGNLLTIMNHVAAQPHVTLPTTYSQFSPVRVENQEAIGNSMREAVADIHPVVAVEEINRVGKRYNNIKVLDNI